MPCYASTQPRRLQIAPLLPPSVLLVIFLLLAAPSLAQSKEEDNPWWRAWRRRLQQTLLARANNKKEPEPTVVDDFMTAREAETLLQRYGPLLRESLHVMGNSGAIKRSLYRTSRSVRLPPLGDPLVFEMEQRASALAGFPHRQVEDFQLACYGVDELYGLHRDDDDASHANRSATVLIYLEAPIEGGATLFTRRPLEDERDLDTKRKLHTEAGALKLFRQYCARPRRNFVVVEPKVGRAATWPNWYGEGLTQFAKRSTHGACPVIQGQKCVIQQWIAKAGSLPLREERVAAIFPAGADYSFLIGRHNHDDDASLYKLEQQQCLSDVSTHMGQYIPELCLDGSSGARFHLLNGPEGPYSGVGGLRLTGGLKTSVPSNFLSSHKDHRGGLTVSFWARNLKVGSEIFAVGDALSVRFVSQDEENSLQTFELVRGGDSTSSERLQLYNPRAATDWLWCSFIIQGGSFASEVAFYSGTGKPKGKASLGELADDTCMDGKQLSNSTMELRMFTPPPTSSTRDNHEGAAKNSDREMTAFVGQPKDDGPVAFMTPPPDGAAPATADVSFVVFHKAALNSEEAAELRLQALRYNLNQ